MGQLKSPVIFGMTARHHLLLLLLASGLLGCGQGTTPPLTDQPLMLPDPIEHLGPVAVREPMVVEHPDGTLFVAGFSQALEESDQAPKLFRSQDGGTTWRPVDVGSPADGALGNSDVDLAVAPNGILYFLTMGFDRLTGEGTHVAVGVSRDVGDSWTWTFLSRDRFDDRPWIEVTPDGRAHVIWNDGDGVRYASSSDTGVTWTEHARVSPQGHSSHFAGGPHGELAVRITPLSASGNRYHEGIDFLAVSTDGGQTWEHRSAPGARQWSADFANPGNVPRWVEPLAWDAAGTLYYLWSEGATLQLGRSRDLGGTWEQWSVVTSELPLYFPFLAASGTGQLAATWFSGTENELQAHVALIDAVGPEPSVRLGPTFLVDSWKTIDGSPVRDTGGEYLPVLFLSDGDLGVVAPIQNTPDGHQGFHWYRITHPPE